MKTHPRHKFIKVSVEIKQTDGNNRYEDIAIRKVATYKCECNVVQEFRMMPNNEELLFNEFYSDLI